MKVPDQLTTEVYGSLVLSESTIIERVADGKLVLTGEENYLPRAEVTVAGCNYHAGQLSPSLEGALKLPVGAAAANLPDLFAEVKSALTGLAGVARDEATLLAAAVLSTWVADALPIPLHLAVVGNGRLSRLKSVLASLVRFPLVLTDVRATELGTLPAGIEPSLLVSDPSPHTLRQLALTREPGSFQLKSGNLLPVPHCPCFIFATAPVAGVALTVHVTQANTCPLPKFQLEQLETSLRAQLLGYRLARWSAVSRAQFDSPALTSEVRAAAQCLGRALEGEPDAQQSVILSLRGEQERRRTGLEQSDAGLVLEALWTAGHDEQSDRSVKAIAQIANALVAGEGRRFNARAIGSILREQLGFCTQRYSDGYRVLLSRTAGERLHRMAVEFGLTAPLFPREGCDLCTETTIDTAFNGPSTCNVHEVHDVHSAPSSELVDAVESRLPAEEDRL
jgi:hypothetical protein